MAGPMTTRRRRRRRIDPWQFFKSVLSGIFMTVAVFLILTALGEFIVLLFDLRHTNPGAYQDWWSTPLMMIIAAIPFLLAYFVVNISRYKIYHKIINSIRVPPALRRPDDLDDIELD